MTAATGRLLAAGFLGALLLGCFLFGHLGHAAAPFEFLRQAKNFGSHNWAFFLLLQTLIVISGIMPASFVGIAAGALFGLGVGFGLAASSTIIGAVIAFALARSIFRPWVEILLRRRRMLQALDIALGQDGWRSIVLLRLSPVMPFALTSYALGLTAITCRNYLLGSAAALPSLFGFVLLGHFGDRGLDELHMGKTPAGILLILFGVVTTALLTVHLGGIAKRILARG
jgi:uncharacterized membrane protein YdjX (TVP38/TMEM64 family)